MTTIFYLNLVHEPYCYRRQMRENNPPTSELCPGDIRAHKSAGYVCKITLHDEME